MSRTRGLIPIELRWVDVRSLTIILERYLPESCAIAFLKNDVEGHNYDVLQGVCLLRYRPVVILVATIKSCSMLMVNSFSDISQYFCTNGDHEVYFDGVDTWWLAEGEQARRGHHFKYAGVLDGFSPAEIRRLLLEDQQDQPVSPWRRFSRRLS